VRVLHDSGYDITYKVTMDLQRSRYLVTFKCAEPEATTMFLLTDEVVNNKDGSYGLIYKSETAMMPQAASLLALNFLEMVKVRGGPPDANEVPEGEDQEAGAAAQGQNAVNPRAQVHINHPPRLVAQAAQWVDDTDE
jgi:hypothetical protein